MLDTPAALIMFTEIHGLHWLHPIPYLAALFTMQFKQELTEALRVLLGHLAASVLLAWWLRRGEAAAWAVSRGLLRGFLPAPSSLSAPAAAAVSAGVLAVLKSCVSRFCPPRTEDG